MAGEQNILREYLISLGFKVDERGSKQLGKDLTDWDKRATTLARSLVGVATAAQLMVTEFAFRMERLFYASKLAESAAGNLQALDFGAQQVGVKDFTGLVMNLARAIRGNPGLQGLLNSLGVDASPGRDRGDVLKDLVKTLTSMPHYIGQRYAALFGIDPDQLLLLKQGMADMERFAAARAQMAKDLGVDVDAASVAGKEYAQQWREILNTVGLARDALSLTMLPVMREMAGVAQEVLKDWIGIIRAMDKSHQAPPGSITEKGARQSGLTVDEQIEMAQRAPKVKTWSEMTPDERAARGMGRDKPRWADLTPDERRARGMPATAADLPLWARAGNWLGDAMDAVTERLGIAPANPDAAELSSSAKERLGLDRTRNKNPANAGALTNAKDAALDAIGYRSTPRTPYDPSAVAAVNESAARAQDQAPQVPSVPASLPPVPFQAWKRHANEEDILAINEEQKGLPRGLLDYIWKHESARGKAMLSPKGAKGHFGFMDATAADYGLKDPNSLPDSARAAASYMHDLISKYGDLRFALAAYNWGQGNLDKLMARTTRDHPEFGKDDNDRYVLGHLPEETRKYISGLGGAYGDGAGSNVTINADTKIDVHEATDAAATARMIAENQRQVWGDVTRQFSGKVK